MWVAQDDDGDRVFAFNAKPKRQESWWSCGDKDDYAELAQGVVEFDESLPYSERVWKVEL